MGRWTRDLAARMPFIRKLRDLTRGGRKPLVSRNYWEQRYVAGGTSGTGSYGKLAAFKARVLNEFVQRNGIKSVLEFGCGDGNQLELAEYPSYLGVDVSSTAVEMCRSRFAEDSSKRFVELDDYKGERAELVLSLDVIYHLLEDRVFEAHMSGLFSAAERYVCIYSSNRAGSDADAPHVRHRVFLDWVGSNASDWKVVHQRENEFPMDRDGEGSFADFYFLARDTDGEATPPRVDA